MYSCQIAGSKLKKKIINKIHENIINFIPVHLCQNF